MLLVEHCPSLPSVGKTDHGGGSGSRSPEARLYSPEVKARYGVSGPDRPSVVSRAVVAHRDCAEMNH